PRVLATAVLGFLAGWFGVGWLIGLTLFVQMLGTALFVWGAMIEPFRLSMSQITVTTDRLPAGAAPIRLLHISDIHVERLTRREDKLLELAAAAQPDLIVITGDYVNLSYNRDLKTHAQVKELLGKLSAPHGVYATLGSPPVDLREAVVPIFEGLPVQLLRDVWRRVELGDGRALTLLGMNCTHHLPEDGDQLAQLVKVAPNDAPQVLLYHSPELMPQAAAHGVDLYVCGHTHGGQVRLPFIGPLLTSSQLGRKYVMGLYVDGRTHLYVSRGVGLEGLSAPRVRLLAPPEITLVTLQGKSDD
ncbi:MAG: metallophosphoesterase, partial [Anaerolineae bacterium]